MAEMMHEYTQAVSTASSRSASRRKRVLVPLAFLLPWLVSLVVLWYGPIVVTVVLSFFRYNLVYGGKFFGVGNYLKIFQDRFFWIGLKNTFFFLGLFVPLNFLLGLTTAFLLNIETRTIAVWRTLIYLPAVLPTVAILVLGKFIFFPNGLLNTFLGYIGITGPLWLATTTWIKPAAVLLMAWQCGTTTIIYLAGLKSIPAVYYEVAAIDGIGPLRRFLNITLPLLSPTILFRVVIDIIFSLMIFVPGLILPEGQNVLGGPDNATRFFALHLYDKAFLRNVLGEASSIATVLILICFILTFSVIRLSEKHVYYEA
jgi:multiple sugar transport system permease protein